MLQHDRGLVSSLRTQTTRPQNLGLAWILYPARVMNRITVLLCLTSLALLSIGCSRGNDAARAHLAEYQPKLVSDASSVIGRFGGSQIVKSLDLPPSLRLPGLRFAQTQLTHVNLIIRKNPDTVSGYRVWLDGPTDEYADKQTDIPNVTRFSYCNDYPVSPQNRE